MLNPMDLSGRTILVTGASSGIGRETAVLLSRLQAQVILVARDQERLAQTAALLEGTRHHIEPFDLTTIDEIPRWLKHVTAVVGPLHGLVHSAGVHSARPVRLISRQHFEDVMRINVQVAMSLSGAFRQKGVYVRGSSIVLLSSVVALVGEVGIAAYAASKGALTALAKSLALEFVQDHIRVNCVAPAYVQTEMTERFRTSLTTEQMAQIVAMHPLGLGTPLDVAYAIAFLLAETGRWITGTTLVVDGGYTAH